MHMNRIILTIQKSKVIVNGLVLNQTLLFITQSNLNKLSSMSRFACLAPLASWRLSCDLQASRASQKNGAEETVFPSFPSSAAKILVSYAAVLSVVTQRSSPLTAASIRTACLSFCVCGKSKQPIMSQQIDNDVTLCSKKTGGVFR